MRNVLLSKEIDLIEFIDEEGIISPQKRDLGSKVAVTTFSKHLFEALVARLGAEPVCTLPGGMTIDVYRAERGGVPIVVYLSPVGAPAAVGAAEEVMAGGVEHVVAFGICGTLIDIPTRNFVIPTRAFRDEGTSCHYLPTGEFIELKNSGEVGSSLKRSGLSYTSGGTWTTDGFYRETRTRAEFVKSKGCVAVDMECSALQAACDFRGKSFYTFFITADSLAGEQWKPNYIDKANIECTNAEDSAVKAAVELAVHIGKG